MRSRRHLVGGSLAAAVALVLLASGMPGLVEAQGARRVRFGEVRTLPCLPVYVAQTNGYYRDEGLDVEFVTAQAGARLREALLGGDVEFGCTSTFQAPLAIIAGRPMKIVASLNELEIFSLAVRKELQGQVRSVKDLKGRNVGISAPGSGSWVNLQVFARKGGLDPATDIGTVAVGGISTMYAALKGGKVDAVVSWEPATARLLLDNVAYLLIDIANPRVHEEWLGGTAISLVIIAREDLIKKDPTLVRKMVAANNRAAKFISEHRGIPQEVARAVRPYFDGMPPEELVKAIERVMPGVSDSVAISVSGYANDIKPLVELKVLKRAVSYEEAVDPSFAGRKP